MSRRQLLLGGAAGVLGGAAAAVGLVEAGTLPGRGALDHALGRCNIDASLPGAHPGPIVDGVFDSRFRRRPVRYAIAYPPGAATNAALPVALVLHGRGSGTRGAFDTLGLHRQLAGYVAGGGRAFALACADGGVSYWHPRASGDDTRCVRLRHGLRDLRGPRPHSWRRTRHRDTPRLWHPRSVPLGQ